MFSFHIASISRNACALGLLTLLGLMSTPAHSQTLPTTSAARAPKLDGLGTLTMPVGTRIPEAQRFFDQGLRLLYAFNHQEALRAFEEAARLDSALSIAYWGQAMALGPNLNAPLTPANGRLAYEAIVKAQAAHPRRTPASGLSSMRWRRDFPAIRRRTDRCSIGRTRRRWHRSPDATRTIPTCRPSMPTP